MTPEQLRLRDEILQVMYWLRGEGLGEQTNASQLGTFLPDSRESIDAVLQLMKVDGFVRQDPDEQFSLSDLGITEGGRRFAEEFADAGINAGGHGTCAPGCDCELHGHECCEHRHEHNGAVH